MGSQVAIWPTSSGMTPHPRKRKNDLDDPLEQIIERVPHTLTELAELTREHVCWTYIKPHARVRNGRTAYMAFKSHYLGPNNIDMAATAEHKFINATYRGEGRHWGLERYATLQRNNIPFLNDSRKMDMQKWMKRVKQDIYKQGSRPQHLIVSRH